MINNAFKAVEIAIDCGKDSTKFVYNNGFKLQQNMFRTKVQKVENFGMDVQDNTFIVKYENETYLIGDMLNENKLSYDLSKTTIEHKLSIYVAISRTLKKLKSNNNKVNIAIGAPLSICKNLNLKEQYRDYIYNNGHVNIEINNEDISFAIENVLVLPESVGPIYSNLNYYRNERIVIFDIGGLNTNICEYKNLIPNISSMLVANKGGNILKSKIAEALSEKFGTVIYKSDVEEIIRDNGILYINGKPHKESKPLIINIMKEHLLDIINFAKQNEQNTFGSNGKVVFCGGGSLLLKDIIQEIYPHAKIADDAQYSNVLAFYKILGIKNGQA